MMVTQNKKRRRQGQDEKHLRDIEGLELGCRGIA